MRKYLLWDNDGVLVDTERLYFTATQESLAELGCDFDQSRYLELMARGAGYWEAARQKGASEELIRSARQKRDELYRELLAKHDIEIPGVADVLAELSTSYRMAIVTTSTRTDFELIHAQRQILRYFEFVLTADDCAVHKPAPDPYLQALRRFDGVPSEAVVIEDSARGLRSAIAAGIDCVVIRNAFTSSHDFTGAWRILDSVRDLPTVLNAIRA